MKTFFTFLAICLLSFLAFAQTETAKKVAKKITESGEGFGCDWNTRLSRIRDEGVFNSEGTVVLIIYKGIFEKSKSYSKQIINIHREIDFVGIDRTKIKLTDGGFRDEFTVEFWIVPEGAENPKPTNYSEKFGEIGNANDKKFLESAKTFYNQLEKKENAIGYLVNYGTKKQKAFRIKQINRTIDDLDHNRSRLIIVDGGYSKKLKTEFWIVPPKGDKR